MQTLLEFFGFTTLYGIAWNIIGYLAFIGIIIGVFSERYRNTLITLGAGALAIYSGIFLHNPLFTALQTLIVISGLLQWTKISKQLTVAAMIILTVSAYLFLAWNGTIVDVWSLIGSFGLLGIAFGLITLPRRLGFIFMAIGGALLVVYGFVVEAWVFFFLNIFFVFANIRTWLKK